MKLHFETAKHSLCFIILLSCTIYTANASKLLTNITFHKNGSIQSATFKYDAADKVKYVNFDNDIVGNVSYSTNSLNIAGDVYAIENGRITISSYMSFSYTGNKMTGMKEGKENHEIIWSSNKQTSWKTYKSSGDLCYESHASYGQACNNKTLVQAINLTALLFADPEEVTTFAMFYMMAPYLGEASNELVKRVTADENMHKPSSLDNYDCIYTYTMDSDGDVIKMEIDVTSVERDGASTQTYSYKRQIDFTWSGTSSINDVSNFDSYREKVYTINGIDTGYSIDQLNRLPKGLYIVNGKKIAK